MTRALIAASILVFSVLRAGFAQEAASPQNRAAITGADLLRMLRSNSGAETDRASSLIGEIYGPELNNGIIPDNETLYGLGRILMEYMTAHPASQGRSVEDLVKEVLKNAPMQIEEQKAFWNNTYKAAEAYFLHPSPENAEKLYRDLPDKRLPYLDPAGERRLIYLVFDLEYGKNSYILEKRMAEGEPHAADVGFRLINISDGAAGEWLVHALGEILIEHPRLFLQKLLAHQGKTEPAVFELLDKILNPVAWWEMPEDDKNEEKYLALFNKNRERRMRALESVEDEDLREIRDRCLWILEKMRRGCPRTAF